MEAFNLINNLRNYCNDNGIFFIPGTNAYVNAVADNNIYAADDLILICDFNSNPIFNGNRISSNTYTGLLMLGRKTEVDNLLMDENNEYIYDETNDYVSTTDTETTVSSLDETYEQKYDRRLRYLANKLADIIGDIVCTYEYEVSNVNFKLDINKFDLNIDCIAATLTLSE